jgi:hypothetical protein
MSIAATTAAFVVAGSSIVNAQQRVGPRDESGSHPRFEQRYLPNIEDIKAFTDARIAALKAGLQLAPDQENNWPPFEQALRALAELHLQNIQTRDAGNEQQQLTDPFARLQSRADAMSQFASALKHIADTGEPLYQSLSEGQKRRFAFLARMLRPHWMTGGGFWQEHRLPGSTDRGRGMMSRESDEDSENL